MVESTKSYHESKIVFEAFLLRSNKFSEVNRPTNTKSYSKGYPITSYECGVNASVRKYVANISGSHKAIYNSISNPRLNSLNNLTYSQFKKSVKHLDEFMINSENTILSGMKLGFTIPTKIRGRDLIRLNILMHKFQYYNFNKVPQKRQEIKEFDKTNYSIGFYADKKNIDKQYYIKIVLEFHNRKEFDEFEIKNINDLLKKDILRKLFDLFMKKFNEMIIVDNYKNIEGNDHELLKDFLGYRYWRNLSQSSSRSTPYRHRMKFHKIIKKHNLNTQKLYLENELRKAFEKFISN